MPPTINKATIMSSGSVVALYVETILQTYITISYNNGSSSVARSPEALISLCSTCIAFVTTSIASYILANSSECLDNNENNTKTKAVFRFLHIFQLGYFWRIFKMITSFTGSDVIPLTNLRLAHVTVQSLPYIIIYSSIFLIEGKISPIQSLSLVVSLLSSALAVTSYNLRLKFCTNESDIEDTGNLKNSGKFKSSCAVLATFVGTLLVLFSRITSITLMAAQVHLWVLIPLSGHFVLILVIFILFSSRSDAFTSRILVFTTHSLYCLGMSVLNTFDLVYDNISHVMCKYVAFYSLLLVENIIFISFWLLDFDFDYLSKLVTVLGILSAFIVGLVVKFTGCTFSQWDPKMSKNEEDSSIRMPSITTTIASATLSFVNQPTMNKDDDLISIVQASLAHRSQRNEQDGNGRFLESSLTDRHNNIQLNVTNPQTVQETILSSGRKNKHKPPKNKTKSQTKFRTKGKKGSTDIVTSANSVQNLENKITSIHTLPSTNPHNNNLERSKVPINTSMTTDQNDSFQHSSVLSVSDPETLLSDMMYDEVGGEVCCHMPDESLQENIIKNSKRMKDSKQYDLSKSQGSHESNHLERIRTIHNLNHQPFLPKHKSSTISKSRPSQFINTTPASKFLSENRKIDRRHLKENQYRDSTNQNNESSDNAVSSAKTYPRNSKFDKEMKNILSSIGASDDPHQNIHTLNPSTLPYRFSDSEAVVRNNIKPGRSHSSNNRDKKIYKNIITYTEPDDMNTNNAITSNTKTNTNSRHTIKKSDHHERKISTSSTKPSETKGDKSQRVDYGNNTNNPKGAAPPPRIISSNAIQLCESGSSSFTTTVTHGNITQTGFSSSTTTMTTDDCWQNDRGHSSDAKSDRLSQFLMQSDTDRISPSENILRWLSITEASNFEHV